MSSYSGTLSKAQLESLWEEAGGPASDADEASAIALAESSGEVDAKSPVEDEGSYAEGLWQIETPMHNSQLPGGNPYNPLANAEAAVAISNHGANWTPWETFTSGAYKRYLGNGGSGSATTSTKTSTKPATKAKTNNNPLLPGGPESHGSGEALKDLAYILLFAIGAGLLYMGITRAAGRKPTGEPS
jgi:hypothetical protein